MKRDHRVIERALGGIEAISEDMARTGNIPVETLAGLVVFSQTFIDRCHHGKEEVCLFPCLERRGVPREGGPIGVMLHEHRVGRELVAKIGEELAANEATKADAKKLLQLLTEYVTLLRAHIAKEEAVLFQMGDRLMSPDDRESSLECYERTEEEKLGPGKHEEMLKLADRIASAK